MSVESQAPEYAAPETAARRGGVRLWFAALFRALWIIVLTLAILAAMGYGADVILHRVTHASHSSATYMHIYAIEVILDGDGSVSVTGTPNNAHQITLAETDHSTMFNHPQRAVSVIGGTLFISLRCPDSLCTADLALTVAPDTHVSIRMGNALRLGQANMTVKQMNGPIDVAAWPANVSIVDSSSLVTGDVAGSLTCGEPAVCIVQVPR